VLNNPHSDIRFDRKYMHRKRQIRDDSLIICLTIPLEDFRLAFLLKVSVNETVANADSVQRSFLMDVELNTKVEVAITVGVDELVVLDGLSEMSYSWTGRTHRSGCRWHCVSRPFSSCSHRSINHGSVFGEWR